MKRFLINRNPYGYGGMADILFGENAEASTDTIGDEFEPNVKDLTSRILEHATFHQSQASKRRLHNTVRTAGSISGSSTSSLGFKNLNKAQKVVADRKKKVEEAKLTEAGIRIAATLWILDNSLKSRKVPSQVRPHTLSFPPEIRIWTLIHTRLLPSVLFKLSIQIAKQVQFLMNFLELWGISFIN